VNPTMIVQAKTTLDLYRVGVDIENGINWDWDTYSDADDDDGLQDPSYQLKKSRDKPERASRTGSSNCIRRSQGGGRSRLGAGSGCGEAGRGKCSPWVTSPPLSSPMPPAETRRERFPAALQGKGKEPADDNDSRITASAAAVADTDLLADADAAAGSRDSEEMVDASGSGDLEDGGREEAEPMGMEVRTLCVQTFVVEQSMCTAISHLHLRACLRACTALLEG
jgi:hypothetical protein